MGVWRKSLQQTLKGTRLGAEMQQLPWQFIALLKHLIESIGFNHFGW